MLATLPSAASGTPVVAQSNPSTSFLYPSFDEPEGEDRLTPRWIEPVEGAAVGPELDLVVRSSASPADAAMTEVVFHARWEGGEAELCRATAGDARGLWSCRADLSAAGIKAGTIALSFDIVGDAGQLTRTKDGQRNVNLRIPPRNPVAFLRSGIPAPIKDSCGRLRAHLPAGTFAALRCRPDTRAIAEMAYYLLSPSDARAVWSERMAEYSLRPGGACARGEPGIESQSHSRSVGCYRNEFGYANLRFASSAGCPAVYWAVLGTGRDIARLWETYERVAGEGWTDPGSWSPGDGSDCRPSTPPVTPPGVPDSVVARRGTGRSLTPAMRRACRREGLPLSGGIGSCVAIALRWEPASGRVDRYEVRLIGWCTAPDGVGWKPWDRAVARIDPSSSLSYIYAYPAIGINICEGRLHVVAVSDSGRAAVPARGGDVAL